MVEKFVFFGSSHGSLEDLFFLKLLCKKFSVELVLMEELQGLVLSSSDDFKNLLSEGFISVNGWPFREKFGSDASAAAWLIAQHADHGSMFQLQCLSFILVDLGDDPDSRQDVAFLLDRILLNHGSKQLFGTQMNGSVGVPDVLDKKNLGMLRERFCLEPLDQYIERMRRFSHSER